MLVRTDPRKGRSETPLHVHVRYFKNNTFHNIEMHKYCTNGQRTVRVDVEMD